MGRICSKACFGSVGLTEMGSPAILTRSPVTLARAMRLRRSATSNAFEISQGQIEGTRASAPAEIKSSTPSVNFVASSSKHQATATDASSTNRLVPAAFIDQLAYRDFAQSRPFSQLPNAFDQTASVLLPAVVRRNQLRHWNAAARNPDRLPLGGSLQQFVEMSLRVKCTHTLHNCNSILNQLVCKLVCYRKM